MPAPALALDPALAIAPAVAPALVLVPASAPEPANANWVRKVIMLSGGFPKSVFNTGGVFNSWVNGLNPSYG